MGRKIAGPGEMGSMSKMRKSLKNSGGSGFRTIPGEDALTVRFLQNPEEWYGFYLHWMKDGPLPCTTDDCEGCNSDDEEERRKQFRYLADAYVVDDQKVEAVLIPKTLAEQLTNYYDKHKKTLLDRDYDLTKTGTGKTNTKYMASPDSPHKMNLSRFEGETTDHAKILQKMLTDRYDDDEDEEDEEETKPRKSKSHPKKSSKKPWDDDDEDDEDEDDEPVRRPKKKKSASVARKRPVKRTAKKTVAKRRVRR